MKQNVLSLPQSAIILISPGIAMQLHGQPVRQHVISNSQSFMAAVNTGHSNLSHGYSVSMKMP
jgi:hypothetical protein